MGREAERRCYYCGGDATSWEHVPPKAMFRGFQCDSITVPSCRAHNAAKGADDQGAIAALLYVTKNVDESGHVARRAIKPEVALAVQKAKRSFQRAKRRAVSRPLLSDPPQALGTLPEMAYVLPSFDIWGWMREMTAGLVWDACRRFVQGIDWSRAAVWSPNWVACPEESPLRFSEAVERMRAARQSESVLEGLDWHAGWSAYPRGYPPAIYHFSLHVEGWGAVFKHEFYGQYTFYVAFEADQRTLVALRFKALDYWMRQSDLRAGVDVGQVSD